MSDKAISLLFLALDDEIRNFKRFSANELISYLTKKECTNLNTKIMCVRVCK